MANMDATEPSALLAENAILREQLARLQATDRVYSSILEHAPLLISAKDLHGNVVLANRHFEVLDGYDGDHFVGQNVFDLFPPEIAE